MGIFSLLVFRYLVVCGRAQLAPTVWKHFVSGGELGLMAVCGRMVSSPTIELLRFDGLVEICGRAQLAPTELKAFCLWWFRFRREQATRPTILRVNKAVGRMRADME